MVIAQGNKLRMRKIPQRSGHLTKNGVTVDIRLQASDEAGLIFHIFAALALYGG
jgi:hypothetical protein